ncbi:MAG: amino acid-binding protein, partial [Methanobrevibacter boviskoreani]|nr:amino acid-binding protein [Methanobrevibacter boviskoreani]
VDKLNELENVTVTALDIEFNNEEKSSALITVEMALGLKQKVLNRINEIAASKDLLVINEV